MRSRPIGRRRGAVLGAFALAAALTAGCGGGGIPSEIDSSTLGTGTLCLGCPAIHFVAVGATASVGVTLGRGRGMTGERLVSEGPGVLEVESQELHLDTDRADISATVRGVAQGDTELAVVAPGGEQIARFPLGARAIDTMTIMPLWPLSDGGPTARIDADAITIAVGDFADLDLAAFDQARDPLAAGSNFVWFVPPTGQAALLRPTLAALAGHPELASGTSGVSATITGVAPGDTEVFAGNAAMEVHMAVHVVAAGP